MMMKYLLAALGCAAFASTISGAAAQTLPAPTRLYADEMKWEPMAEGSPLKIVKLWGDHTQDANYGMLVKLPAGFSTGMHSHSQEYFTIEIQGKKIHRFKDEAQAKEYTPGSFTYETPGHVHEDVCVGPEDCILFIHQGKRFDFIPDEK